MNDEHELERRARRPVDPSKRADLLAELFASEPLVPSATSFTTPPEENTMITTILRNATRQQLVAAYRYTADHLHIPVGEVTDVIAVAYVCAHFEQGVYLSWEGFADMLEADAR